MSFPKVDFEGSHAVTAVWYAGRRASWQSLERTSISENCARSGRKLNPIVAAASAAGCRYRFTCQRSEDSQYIAGRPSW